MRQETAFPEVFATLAYLPSLCVLCLLMESGLFDFRAGYPIKN